MKRAGDADDYGVAAGPGMPLFDAPAVDLFAASTNPPTDLERVVAGILATRRGWRQAIPLASLMAATGRDERHTRGVVEQLIVTHRLRIGASVQAPSGYYMIETAEDLERAVSAYRGQIFAMLRRLRVLMAPHQVAELMGQLKVGE